MTIYAYQKGTSYRNPSYSRIITIYMLVVRIGTIPNCFLLHSVLCRYRGRKRSSGIKRSFRFSNLGDIMIGWIGS